MDNLVWYSRYPADYARDTAGLSLIEHGAYGQLMDAYYLTGEALPNNTESLARICRAHSEEEIKAVSTVIKQFFYLKNDKWHQRRIDRELKEARQIIEKRRRSGRMGGLARAQAHAKQMGKQNTKQTSTQSQSHTHTQEESKAKALCAFELPDWIPADKWKEYEKMRRTISKPMTDAARRFAVRALDELRASGQSVSAVLEQSIFNSWQGLFPVREQSNGADRGNHQRPTEQRREPSAQVERRNSNIGNLIRSRAAAAAGNAGVGNCTDSTCTGQAARHSGGDVAVVEGEVIPVQRSGN